jgi:exodeoxyribonuclease VII small subunit
MSDMPPSPDMPTPSSPSTPVAEAGFDQVLAQLRAIVERLEGGNLSLEQSLAAFEDGVRLSRAGARILDAAEHRVEILMRDESGADKAVPFGGGGEAERGNR